MGGCCSAEAIDADEALATLQAEAPELVIDGEDFLFAFAFMRDQVYFTNLRILVKDKQGMFGSSIAWKTIPYSAIKAFFVETAGALDSDVELGLWPSGWSGGDFSEERMMPSPCYTLSFKKDAVDLFALQRLLNGKIFNPSSTDAVEVVPPPEEDAGTMSKMMDMLGGDARSIDPTIVQEQLRADPPVLLPDEVVDMAFKCGRDTYALTSSRMLVIDVKGMTGKCVRYTSYLWSCIKAFAVQTPGAFLDRDCELKLWNGIAHVEENLFAMDLRDSGTDIMGVQRCARRAIRARIRPRHSSNGAALPSTTGTSPTASSARTRRRRRRRRTARARPSRRSEPSWSGSRATAGRSTPTKRTGCSTRTSGCCRGARRWRWPSRRRATRSSSRRSGWS